MIRRGLHINGHYVIPADDPADEPDVFEDFECDGPPWGEEP